MNNRTVAHEWANQTRGSRRGSNFYFEGPALYSYGSHFVVGLIVTIPRSSTSDGRGVLLNSRSYSSSTAKHQSMARSAASHLQQFYVPAPGLTPSDVETNYKHYAAGIARAQGELLRGRVRLGQREGQLLALIHEAARYAQAFPLKGPTYKEGHAARRAILKYARNAEAGTLISAADRARITAKIERAAELERTAEARRIAAYAEQAQKNLDRLNAWTDGGPDRPIGFYGPNGVELPTRLRIHGAAVETSHGAVVSVRAARIAWAAIKAGRDIIGMVLDGYTVTAFNGVLKIGCHTIDRAEVDRIGAQLDAAEAKPCTKTEADAAIGLNADGTARPE